MKCGVLFRPGSLWVGAHWSRYNRRLCVNLVPCVTIWFTLKGGVNPGCRGASPKAMAKVFYSLDMALEPRKSAAMRNLITTAVDCPLSLEEHKELVDTLLSPAACKPPATHQ